MTDEEKACKAICDSIPCKTMCTKCKCYIAGFKAGRETKWHNLRENHNDLPEPYVTVLDEEGNRTTYQGRGKWTFYSDYHERDIDAIPPVAWCEIPKFKE